MVRLCGYGCDCAAHEIRSERAMTDSVQFEQRGRLGVATLNRPKALNALTLEMVRSLHRQIAAWESDRSVHAVMLRGEGRAFCAGGDVRAVHASRHHPPGPGDYKTELFREEFHLMRHIHRFRKPWVALTHGITMGGGARIPSGQRQRCRRWIAPRRSASSSRCASIRGARLSRSKTR